MGDVDLRKLQLTELDILLEIDRICKKHDIRYFLDAGTLLGAVRHKGFIPWDDDIDILMPLSEYKRFCRAAKKEMREPYFLQNFNTDRTHRWFSKVRKSGTTFIEKGYERQNMHQGVWVDVFPLIGVPEDEKKRSELIRRARGTQKILKKRMETLPWRELSVYSKLLHCIPLGLVRLWVTLVYAVVFREYSEYPCCDALWGSKTFVPRFRREWFAETCEVEFEGHMLPAMKAWDAYLTKVYGDYMTPPPPEKRGGGCHEVAIVDLDRDYTEYRRQT